MYWRRMDRDIESLVKSRKGCTLAVKVPPIHFSPWPETDFSWSRLHIDFAGPLNGSYYLIIVESFSKWPEILRCKKLPAGIFIRFLQKLFTRFGVPVFIVSDNAIQFTSKEFKGFCKMFVLISVTSYHPSVIAKQNVFKNALSAMTPAEIMFARKIRSVFDKKKKSRTYGTKKKKMEINFTNWAKSFYYRMYQTGKRYWGVGTIVKRIGRMIYLVKRPKMVHKRHWNQIKSRHIDEENDTL